jgi:hypothetical protein
MVQVLCVWLIGLLGLVIYHPHMSVAARGPLLALPQRSPSLARSHHSCTGFLPSSRPAAVSRSQPLAWSRSRTRPAGAFERAGTSVDLRPRTFERAHLKVQARAFEVRISPDVWTLALAFILGH